MNGANGGMDFTPFWDEAIHFALTNPRISALPEGQNIDTFDFSGTPVFAGEFADSEQTAMGGRLADVITPSGPAEGFWMSSIRNTLWMGTSHGSVALVDLDPTTASLTLSDDPTSGIRTDNSSQVALPPLVSNDVLFQLDNLRTNIYVIEDSDELKRRTYTVVSKALYQDFLSRDPIKSIAGDRSLGFVGILTDGGRTYYGLIKGQEMVWAELSFNSIIDFMSIGSGKMFLKLNGQGTIKQVNFNRYTPIEVGSKLELELASASIYSSEFDPDEVAKRQRGDLAKISKMDLLGRFGPGGVGVGRKRDGILSTHVPENGLIVSRSQEFGNISESLRFFFPTGEGTTDEDRSPTIVTAKLYLEE